MAFVEQLADHGDLFGDVARGARGNVGTLHIQRVHIAEKLPGVGLGDLHRLFALQARLLEELVFAGVGIVGEVTHIRDVLHIAHRVAEMAQIALDHVEGDITFRVTEVRRAVHGGSAHVHPHKTGGEGLEDFFFAGERVVNGKGVHG